MTTRRRRRRRGDDGEGTEPTEPVVLPITGELDLHTFAPEEATAVVADYLDECRRRGILDVRIVHGRGRGVRRAEVRRALASARGRRVLPRRAAFVGRLGRDSRRARALPGGVTGTTGRPRAPFFFVCG